MTNPIETVALFVALCACSSSAAYHQPPQQRSDQPSAHAQQGATANSGLLRHLGTLGVLAGAIEVQAALERRLGQLRQELNRQPHPPKDAKAKLDAAAIVGTLERAEVALEILGIGLDLATAGGAPSATFLRRELLRRTQEVLRRRTLGIAESTEPARGKTISRREFASGRTELLERQIDQRLKELRRKLAPRIVHTVSYLEGQVGGLNRSMVASTAAQEMQRLNRLIQSTIVQNNDVQGDRKQQLKGKLFRRQDDGNGDDDGETKSTENASKELAISVEQSGGESESQESSESSEEGPGGLVGLIASLSGGDEGSDVGALIGSLSSVVTNLFGPGGLDVPGLLGTGTSLIAGLLGGDDNFGKVLGSYVGITIEGLSGGGADMNGAFFGNFLGALIAALSSDPEDENLPLKPKLFVENFFSGLQEAKRKGDQAGDAEQCCQKGSDLFGFLGNIISSVVGGITSLVLNASLGSSGGSSQGSADASGASSAGSSSGDHPPAHPAT